MRIGFISCVKQKRPGKHKAKELYISPLFKKMFLYATRTYDKVYILSAKYGVVSLDTEIESYEKTLNKMSKREVLAWSFFVANKIKELTKPEDELFFICGKNYYENVVPQLPNKCSIILENLSMGQRLQKLKEMLS